MKKTLSILLCLVMIISMVPCVFAAESEEIGETAGPELLQEARATVTEEAVPETPEPRSDEAVPEADVPEWWETESARIEEKNRLCLDSEEDAPQLMAAGTSSLTVTLSLPAGANVKAESYFYVYLYTACKVGANYKVVDEGYFVKSKKITFPAGSTSANVIFDGLEVGTYVVNAFTNSGNTTGLSSVAIGDYYYDSDGTYTESRYLSGGIAVSGSKSVSYTLPDAGKRISGTIQFSSPIPENTSISVYAYDRSSQNLSAGRASITAQKGCTSADFSLSAGNGAYYLEFSGANGWQYLDLNGDLTKDFNEGNFLYCNTSVNSCTGIVVNGDTLIGEGSGPDTTEYRTANIEIKLPEACSSNRRYSVFILPENGILPNGCVEYYDYLTLGAAAGAQSISASVSLPAGQKFYFAYVDRTDFNSSTSGSSYPWPLRFVTESGIGSANEAELFTVGESDFSVVFDDSVNYKISGNVTTGQAVYEIDYSLIVIATFENGEQYFGSVEIPAGETVGQYQIYVPTRLAGKTYTLRVCRTRWNDSPHYLLETASTPESYGAMTGNVAANSITYLDRQSVVSGTVTFSNAAMRTVVLGMGATIDNYSEQYVTHVVPVGVTSFDYSFKIPYMESIRSYLSTNEMTGLSVTGNHTTVSADSNGDFKNVDYCVTDSYGTGGGYTVSGSMILPEGVTDDNVSARIWVNGMGSSYYSYLSIIKGQTKADYSITLPASDSMNMQIEVYGDSKGEICNETYNLQNDWTFGKYYSNIALDQNHSSVNLQLKRGYAVSGKITLEEGLPSDSYAGQIYLEPLSGGNNVNKSFRFTGTEYDYKIAVETPGEYLVRYYLNPTEKPSNPAIVQTNYYYSAVGTVRDRSAATGVTAPASGVDMQIRKGYTIPVEITLAEGLPNDYYYVELTAIPLAGGTSFSRSINVNGAGGTSSNVQLAVETEGTYKISFRLSSANQDNNPAITGTTYYANASGQTTEQSAAGYYPIPSTEPVGFTIGKGYQITVNIGLEEGLENDQYRGYIYLYDTAGNEKGSKYFNFTGTSASYQLSVDPEEKFRVGMNVYNTGSNNDKVLTYQEYYLSDTGYTDTIANAQQFEPKDGDTLNIKIRKASQITVNIGLEAGLDSDNYWGYVYLYHTNGSQYKSQYFEFTGISGAVTLSLTPGEEYLIGMRVNGAETNYSKIIRSQTYFISQSGGYTDSTTDAKPYALSDGATVEISIRRASLITVNIGLEAGLTSDHYDGYVYLYDADGSRYKSESFSFTGTSGAVTIAIIPGEQYLVGLYVNSAENNSDHVLTWKTYYVSDTGGYTEQKTEAKQYTFNDGGSVSMDIRKVNGLAVNIALEDGLADGYYYGYITVYNEKNGQNNSTSFSMNEGTRNTTVYRKMTDPGTYLVSYEIYTSADSKVVTGTYFYYVGDGEKWSAEKGNATSLDFTDSDRTIDLTLTTGKLISGKLVSTTGDAVTIGNITESVSFYLQASSSTSFRGTFSADGSYCFAVPENLTGEYKLRVSLYSSLESNILLSGSSSFYYNDSLNVESSQSKAPTFTIGESNVTGIDIPVETGWRITGSLVCPEGYGLSFQEGFTYTTFTVYMNNEDGSGSSISGNGRINKDGTSSYSVVVPQTPATYRIRRTEIRSSEIITELCIKNAQTMTGININGDTSGVDFILEKPKGTISGIITRPDGVSGSLSVTVYAQFILESGENVYYTADSYMESNENTCAYQIRIPESCTSSQYRMYYSCSNSSINRTAYLKTDGTMSKDISEAAVFTLGKADTRHIPLMLLQPYLTGKIYVPEGIRESFEISLFGYLYTTTITVNPADCKSDQNGRYVEYGLKYPNADNAYSYRFSYRISTDNSGKLYTGTLYYSQENGLVFNYNDATTYDTAADNTIEFTPLTWADVDEGLVFVSDHGVDNYGERSYQFNYPDNVESVTMVFSPYTDCTVAINWGESNSASKTSSTIRNGNDTYTVGANTFTLSFSAGYSSSYGFGIKSISLNYETNDQDEPEIVAVYAMDGEKVVTEQTPLERVKAGESIKVQFYDPELATNESFAAVGAVYDASGKLIGKTMVKLTQASGDRYTVDFDFDANPEAASLKVFFFDAEGKPLTLNYDSAVK